MKVVIKGVVYNAELEPIQIILSEKDKENIANMHSDKFNYVCYPDNMDWGQAQDILKINNK